MTVTYEFAMDFNKPEVNHNVMQLDLSIGKGHLFWFIYMNTQSHTHTNMQLTVHAIRTTKVIVCGTKEHTPIRWSVDPGTSGMGRVSDSRPIIYWRAALKFLRR